MPQSQQFPVKLKTIYKPTFVKIFVKLIKSITAKQIFQKFPEVKKQLWGGEFWSDGYFVSTVGKHGDENMIGKYVQNQGKNEYAKLHANYQLRLFD